MRTILIGKASERQRDMFAACKDALAQAEEALKPGRPIGEVFDAHARVMDGAGFRQHRLAACGYSLGATFSPNWMDWPMFYAGNPVVAEPNMVFFLHMIVLDSDSQLAMSLGRTVAVTEAGCESLSKAPLELIVN